jgi:hypothetical protein
MVTSVDRPGVTQARQSFALIWSQEARNLKQAGVLEREKATTTVEQHSGAQHGGRPGATREERREKRMRGGAAKVAPSPRKGKA